MKRKLPLAYWWTLNTLNKMIKRKVNNAAGLVAIVVIILKKKK